MKYIVTITLIFFFSSFLYSQEQGKIYYTSDGKGVNNSESAGYYRVLTEAAPGSPIDSVHDYYMSGALRTKGTSPKIDRDDDRETIWIGRKLSYYKGGQLLADDFFNRDGKLDSVSTRYFESGKIRQLIVSKDGAVVDKFYKEWDESGHGEKIFTDLFLYDNNKNGWPLNSNDKHECKIIKNEGLKITNFDDNGTLQSLKLPLDPAVKYSIETAVEVESGDGDLWHGLIWGFKDKDNYFFYYINTRGHYRIGCVVEGIAGFYVKDGYSDDIKYGKGVANQLKLLMEPGRLYYSANGKLIYQMPSYNFEGDRIGFAAGAGRQQVLFHSITVKQSIDDDAGSAESSAGGGNSEFKGWKGMGSGFFVDAKGYIATAYHVIANANEIEVDATQDGERNSFKATVVSGDKQNDLALLKITDEKFKPYESLPYNFKTEVSDVASDVFALGFPVAQYMGTEVKFTDGKISSKTGINNNPENYQISVPVQPGNSGGPLFDYDGNIIGIVDSKLENVAVSNVAYAIKSGYLKNFLDALPEKLTLPHDPSLAPKPLTEKIKVLTDYVVLIKVK